MKTQNRIRAAGLLLLTLLFQLSFGKTIGGSVMGQVTDAETLEPIEQATVVFQSQGTQKVFTTNEHGYYYASNIPAGVYTVIIGYLSKRDTLQSYKVSNEDNLTLDLKLGVATTMNAFEFTYDRRGPIIDPLEPQKAILNQADLKHMPIPSVKTLVETFSGTVTQNGEVYAHGSRAGGLSYYIDGGRVMGTPDIPLCGLDTYRMYNGFIPPKYGDTTGGVVVMETRNYFGEQ